jgi:hypothetical protein
VVVGLMQYVWALLATLLVVSGAVLVYRGVPLVPRPDGLPSRLLMGAVVFALFVPKLVASPSLPQFLACAVTSVVLGPTLTLFQGISFLLGAFGSKWIPRGARGEEFGARQAMRTCATFFPSMVLGLILWSMVSAGSAGAWGGGLLGAMAAGMILSPAVGLVLSWPLPVHDANCRARRHAAGGNGGIGSGGIGSGISHATI